LLQGASGEKAEIEFTDNGVGFIETGNSKRHGIGLVRRLMEQIDGSANLQSDKGTAWTLKFPIPVLARDRDAGDPAWRVLPNHSGRGSGGV
jgi:two-component sensor histidine kinase